MNVNLKKEQSHLNSYDVKKYMYTNDFLWLISFSQVKLANVRYIKKILLLCTVSQAVQLPVIGLVKSHKKYRVVGCNAQPKIRW